MMSNFYKTDEKVKCEKKYLYEHSMFWECNDGCKCQILEDDIVNLLNKQQSKIKEQNKEIEEWEFSFRTEMAHHRVAEKELKEKIREQQNQIKQLNLAIDDLLSYVSCDEIKKQNEILRNAYLKIPKGIRDVWKE